MAPPNAPQIWSIPGGEAHFDPRSRAWWHTGLDKPFRLSGDDSPSLSPTLGEGDAVLHLATSLRIPPGAARRLCVAWPVVHEIRVGQELVDRLRPIMRQTLLGAVHEGRVLPGCVVPTLEDHDPIPEGYARLTLQYQHEGREPATIRRVPFHEGSVTLGRTPGGLVAGTIVLRISDGDRASTTIQPLPEDGSTEVVRPGRAQTPAAEPRGLQWWIDGTRRSMGFRL